LEDGRRAAYDLPQMENYGLKKGVKQWHGIERICIFKTVKLLSQAHVIPGGPGD
jgi:hypothetical protein